MEFLPAFAEVKEIAQSGKYKVLPVSCEILSDICTPIEAMRILKNVSTHCYMLESAQQDEKWGRYTFMGFEPKMEITCINGEMCADGIKMNTENPSDFLRQILAGYKSPKFEYLPSFTGGLVGYFSYDYLAYSEPAVKIDVEDNEAFKDVDLMLFDKVIAFDNFKQKIILIVNIYLEDAEIQYNKAVMKLKQLADLLKNGKKQKEENSCLLGEVLPLFDKDKYCEMVEKAKHYIKEGDIFQIVLSNRLSAPFEGSLLNTYRMLRTINPSPYMFYFSGTELLKDEKELSEHNMLVDLGRNDLGKISKFGSVQVEKLHSIEKYSHVMHIGSTVRGEIREEYDAINAIEAVLPAGTLSGAPKIRACQLIAELEDNKRGIYGGAIGYIDFSGNMDTCIGIRLAFAKNKKIFIRSGAGIVADSVPENEYQECINKAKAVMQALEAAEGGIDHDIADR